MSGYGVNVNPLCPYRGLRVCVCVFSKAMKFNFSGNSFADSVRPLLRAWQFKLWDPISPLAREKEES